MSNGVPISATPTLPCSLQPTQTLLVNETHTENVTLYQTETMIFIATQYETVNATQYLTLNYTYFETVNTTMYETVNATEYVTINVTQYIPVTATYHVNVTHTLPTFIQQNSTAAEVAALAEEYKKNLTVDVKLTSAYARSKTSADDSRRSATFVGVVGIIFVALPLVLTLLVDVRKVISDIRFYDSMYNGSARKN